MKHNTHIYLAAKAIEFLYEGLGNLHYKGNNKKAAPNTRASYRSQGKILQRMLLHYQEAISEASWAPDDIICDKAQYHTFKLFTDVEFPDSKEYAKGIYQDKYYRASGGGGLPFKIDHLARVIADMNKLRKYNDRFTMRQIMYQFMMISHYVVDAHVPMHCDLRDDPPSANDTTKPTNGQYFPGTLHGKIEKLWEDAVNPIALIEGIIKKKRIDDDNPPTFLSSQIAFDVTNAGHCKEIKPFVIPRDDLMDYMINLCIETKERSLDLFPIDNPSNYDEDKFKDLTRVIFAEAISSLITIWIWIWKD